jgi:hypothetical protein
MWLAASRSTGNGDANSGVLKANQPKKPYMCQSPAPADWAIRSPAPVLPGCPTGRTGPSGR